jgi:hypothetical protein
VIPIEGDVLGAEGDSSAPFIWHKKKKKDKKLGVFDAESTNPAQFREEVELLKLKRIEREEERKQREIERMEAQRDADRAQFGDWEAKEDEFQLSQAKVRAEIRIREGRPRPVDRLAMTFQLSKSPELFEKGFDVDSKEPFRLLERLDMDELVQTTRDIELYLWLEQEPENQQFWQTLLHVARHELHRAQVAEANRTHTHAPQPEGEGYYQVNGNPIQLGAHARVSPGVYRDIQTLLDGKSQAQLEQLEVAIRKKLTSDEPLDTDYWEAMLESVQVWQSKAILAEFHRNLLQMRKKLIVEKRISADALRAEEEKLNEINAESNRSHPEGNDEDDESKKPDMTPEQIAQAVPASAEDEALGAQEIVLSKKAYSWAYKYRPRKPKYVNRVATGYEWNKYNQTHYDTDNPPPKVVQGYKFNIFYPDLLDRSRAPTYRIEPKADGSKDTVILRFIAGSPYEDIAFEIVNKEWEMSHRRGFRCAFDRGVLQLHFQFRRYFYRK